MEPHVKVTRRPALESDTPFARETHHGAYRDVVTRQFGPWDEAKQDTLFARDWVDSQFEILEVDDIPCGYTCIEERAADFHVREIVVHPAHQNRGIGTAVLRETIERARAKGVPVHLGTFVNNRAADLYRRLGFQETGRTDTHILMEWCPTERSAAQPTVDRSIDPTYLASHYGDADTLLIRKETHERYSERPNREFFDWVVAQLDPLRGALVADVGCGPGTYQSRIAARGARIVGVDLSEG